jgi:hypothetical protein
MALGHHTVAWFERQNRALGLPPGTRHSDEWYARAHAQAQAQQAAQQAEAQRQHQAHLDELRKEQQNQIYEQQQTAQQAQQQAQQQAAEQAAAEAARLEAERKHQEDMRHRRDEWDRLNKQGAYDPDGWQSIGHQPDPIAIPDWWLTGPSAPPAALPASPAAPPAAPPVAPPVVGLPPTPPPAKPEKPTSPPPVTRPLGPGEAWTNPLKQGTPINALLGKSAAGAWGAWDKKPSWGSPQPAGQKPAGQITPWGQNRTYRDVGLLGGTGMNKKPVMGASWGTPSYWGGPR